MSPALGSPGRRAQGRRLLVVSAAALTAGTAATVALDAAALLIALVAAWLGTAATHLLIPTRRPHQ